MKVVLGKHTSEVDSMTTKTTLTIMCMWHKKNFGVDLIMGTKDGKGQSGITSSICPKCYSIFEEKLQCQTARK